MTKNFKDYLAFSIEAAMEDYRETEESKRLSEQAINAQSELEARLPQEFLEESLDALLGEEDAQGNFLYFRGYLDCVALLKTLGVI